MSKGAVCVLAGRRIDAADAKERRFPVGYVEEVRRKIRTALLEEGIGIVVSSAACGADLLALDEAGKLGIRRRIVLPFHKDEFERTSVTDRPGAWGRTYQDIISEVEESGDLMVLQGKAERAKSYKAATDAILAEASRLAADKQEKGVVMVIWEGHSHSRNDETASLLRQASSNGFRVREIKTI